MTAYGTYHHTTSIPLSPSLREREESRKRAEASKAKRRAVIEAAHQRERESYMKLLKKREKQRVYKLRNILDIALI
jgi:hypothetical protein